ncbi:hypothetical protein NGRA_1564 [Nosema granulosis]|uniref:Integrase catalytic domain-containing protein n=1 Tax=Nosema granulosis TaxID=83296 RepID=A0A9P6GYS1_9MICR|nr:hypothetical protein NGRA_1564 [Nosema granulosis]
MGGCDFIATRRKFEKVALDLMDIDGEKRYVLVGIDYFTRSLWGARMRSKETSSVFEVLKNWMCEDRFVEEYVTNNGKEFVIKCLENGAQEMKLNTERLDWKLIGVRGELKEVSEQ